MPVDRGELRYGITVEDNFSGNLKKFRDDIAAAKAAWADFKANSRGGPDDFAIGLRSASQETKNFTQNIQNNSATLNQNATVINRVSQTLNQHISIHQRLNVTMNQSAQQANILAVAFGAGGGGLAAAAGAMGASFSITNKAIDLIVSTFSSFALVVRTAVTDSINLNAAMETAGRGIAAVALATGQLSDASGRAVSGSRAMTLAFGEGQRQVQLLRREMIDTSASFADLEAAFKGAISPGLASGLSIDQIRRFSEQLTQAATVLKPGGGGSGALAREQEQIFAGQISGKNLLAQALGIDNTSLQQAREAGVLVEYLTTRLQSFGDVAAHSGDTFEGAFKRIQNVIEQTLQQGGEKFFDQIKTDVQEILKLLIENEPKIREGVTRTFALISVGVDLVRGAIKEVGNDIKAFVGIVTSEAGALKALASVPVNLIASRGETSGFDEVLKKMTQAGAFIDQLYSKQNAGATFTNIARDLETAFGAFNKTDTKAESLSDTLAKMPVSIQASTVSFEKQSQVIAKLEADVRKARESALVGELGGGVFGGGAGAGSQREATAERKIQLDAEFKFHEATRELSARQRIAETDLNKTLAEQLSLRERIVEKFNDKEFVAYQNAIVLAKQLLALEAQEASLRDQGRLTEARQVPVAAARDRLNAQTANLSPTEAKNVAEALKENLSLQDRAVGAERTLAGAKAQTLRAQVLINEAATVRVGEIATKETRTIQDQLPLLTAQARAANLVADAKARELLGNGSQADVQRQQARATLIETQAKAEQDIDKARRSEATLGDTILTARRQEADAAQRLLELLLTDKAATEEGRAAQLRLNEAAATRVALEGQLGAEQKKNAANASLDRARITTAGAQAQHLDDIQNNPIGTGAADAFKEYRDAATVEYNTTIHILQGMTTSFANFTSEAFASIFDPSKRQDITRNFGRLLASLSQMIFQQLINAAAGRALASLFGAIGSLGGAAAGGAAASSVAASSSSVFAGAAAALAGGGIVPSGNFAASLAHFGGKARGFNLGRPAGIPSSDTIPAWLTPGEGVIREPSVRFYGADVINAINDALIDPRSLRAIAGGAVGRSIRAPSMPAFASGGLVTEAARGRGDTPIVQPAIVANEQNMAALLAGGQGAFIQHVQQNKGAIKSALGITGSRS